MLFLYSLLSLMLPSIFANNFDWALGNTTVGLSSFVYCDKSEYLTTDYSINPYTRSFVPTYQIYDQKYDVNGMIGHRIDDQTIYIVFRGSHSLKDWIDDLRIKKINTDTCDECQVHKGFYVAEQSVINDVINEVIKLQTKFPLYRIVVTGHSLGAALATLTAVDLLEKGIPAELIDFGSPRLFNPAGAEYVSTLIVKRTRVSHYKDIVPHVPPKLMDYLHISGEWYESQPSQSAINIIKCDGFEDDRCSSQWVQGLNGDDHMWYLGTYVGCP